MKAIILKGPGPHSELKIGNIPLPKPNSEELLVRVHAAGLNRADLLQRRGKYPPPPGASPILGLEIAGVIEECGSKVKDFMPGQRVFGLIGGGGYAEYCLLDHLVALPIPDHCSYEEAAAIPESFITANETVFVLGGLKAGESLLTHAAGSGVGVAVIQLAKQIGATVYGTVGSQDKMDKTLKLGIEAVINYKNSDFVAQILQFTNNKGVDVIEDFLGAEYLEDNLSALKIGGRLVSVGLLRGAKSEIDLSLIQEKQLKIKGFRLRTQTLEEKRACTARFASRWLELFRNEAIKPIIDKVYPMKDVQQAHERMENNLNFGKIILSLL